MPCGSTVQNFLGLTVLKSFSGKYSVLKVSLGCKKQQRVIMVMEIWIFPENNWQSG